MFLNIYTDNLNIAVFDIETIGLDPDRGPVISASFCDEDGKGLRQYFLDDPSSEYLLISKIFDEFKDLDAIITYNGTRFDIPYIINRAKKLGLFETMPYVWNIDYYKYLKNYWQAGKLLPSLAQMAVEKSLGIFKNRTDQIAGEECISLYNHFKMFGLESDKEKILLHNADDVRQLASITNIIEVLPFDQIMFEMGYLIKGRFNYPMSNCYHIIISPGKFEYQKIVIDANTGSGLRPLDVFEDQYHLQYDSYTGIIKLELFTKEFDDYTYIDISKIPVDINEYINLDCYSSGYLILIQNGNINYFGINKLAADLITKVFE